MMKDGTSPGSASSNDSKQSPAPASTNVQPPNVPASDAEPVVYDLSAHAVDRALPELAEKKSSPSQMATPGSAKANTSEAPSGEISKAKPDEKPETTGQITEQARRQWMLPPDVAEYKRAFDAIERHEPPTERMVNALMERGYLAVIPPQKRIEKHQTLHRQRERFSDLESLLEARDDLSKDRQGLTLEINSLQQSLDQHDRNAVAHFGRLRRWMENDRMRAVLTSAPVRMLRALRNGKLFRRLRAADKREDLKEMIALKTRHREGVTKRYDELVDPIATRQKDKMTYEKGMAELNSHIPTQHGHVVLNVLGKEAKRVIEQRTYQIGRTERELEQAQKLEALYAKKIEESKPAAQQRNGWRSAEQQSAPYEDTVLWRRELSDHRKEAQAEVSALRREVSALRKIEDDFLPKPMKERDSGEAPTAQPLPTTPGSRRTNWSPPRRRTAAPPIIQPVTPLEAAPVAPEPTPLEGMPPGYISYFAPPSGQQAYNLIKDGHLESGNALLLANAQSLEASSYLQLVEKVVSGYTERGAGSKAIEVLKQHQPNLEVAGVRRVAAMVLIKAADQEKMEQVKTLAEAFSPSDRDIARAIHDLAVVKAKSDGLESGITFAVKAADAACSHLTKRITAAVHKSVAQRSGRQTTKRQ